MGNGFQCSQDQGDVFWTCQVLSSIDIFLQRSQISIVDWYCYLGVMLDPLLDFHLQVEYVSGKVKRATNKVSMLLRDRLGIPVDIAIKLYKALVRPHIDYAIAAWASVRDSDLLKLEQVQSQSLRRLTGVKRHSATAALEVLAGIMPVRFRVMDLCSREYVKLMAKCDNHPVKELLQQSVRKGSVGHW